MSSLAKLRISPPQWLRPTTASGSSPTRIVAAAIAAAAVVAAAILGLVLRPESTSVPEISATVAGREAAGRILALPVPLHQAAHEALRAIDGAEGAFANPNDGAKLADARTNVLQARIAIMRLEGDPGMSPEQRTATADLNRQLQRLLISVDTALGD